MALVRLKEKGCISEERALILKNLDDFVYWSTAILSLVILLYLAYWVASLEQLV